MSSGGIHITRDELLSVIDSADTGRYIARPAQIPVWKPNRADIILGGALIRADRY